MKKGDIIPIGSNFEFLSLPKGSIVKITNDTSDKRYTDFTGAILVRVQGSVKVAGTEVVFINIDNGNYWSNTMLNQIEFEIIRYGAK